MGDTTQSKREPKPKDWKLGWLNISGARATQCLSGDLRPLGTTKNNPMVVEIDVIDPPTRS
jgi:hypothetical protein